MKIGQRILVVHYSLSGNTERVADDLATRLGADREKIGDLKSRRGLPGYLRAIFDSIRERHAEITALEKNPKDYALTIIGTPIWAGKITPAVRSYLRMHRGRFNDVAFFTTSGSTAAQKVVPDMERLAGRQAVAFTGFNYGDIKTPALYEEKISAFIAAVQGRQACAANAREHATAAT
ncbi:MAG: flavodoxin [Pseudomonadota bacterium]